MASKRVGVIGGGQLAWMIAAEAPSLDIELIVQAETLEAPAVSRVKEIVLGQVDDAKATEDLAKRCEVVTFENEFIDLEALQQLEQRGINFQPRLNTLAPLLDKYDQRSYLQSIDIPVPKFSLGSSKNDPVADYGYPFVLKARRHGYDGQGTFIVKDELDLEGLVWSLPYTELLEEEFIPFERELGIIAARNALGEIAIYPVTETYQKNQVCHWTITPANVSAEVEQQVNAIARKILEELKVVGVFGIEFFLTKDNRVLVNEIAPRTHNSGHYTLDGCETSQFAMQLQAVTGMPLGSTALKSAGAVMVNLLGFEGEGRSGLPTLPNRLVEESDSDYREKRDRILKIPNSFVHWYGKTSRLGRKLGHVTIVLDEKQLPEAKSIIKEIESVWYEN